MPLSRIASPRTTDWNEDRSGVDTAVCADHLLMTIRRAWGIVNHLSPSLTWLANIVFGGGLIAGTVFFLWQPVSGMKEMAQSETAIKYLCSVCKKTWYITESGTLREQ